MGKNLPLKLCLHYDVIQMRLTVVEIAILGLLFYLENYLSLSDETSVKNAQNKISYNRSRGLESLSVVKKSCFKKTTFLL